MPYTSQLAAHVPCLLSCCPQVYYSLRAGLPEVALKAAEKATDAVQARNTGATVKQLLQHWLDNPVSFRDKHGAQLVGDCERLMHSYSNKQVTFWCLSAVAKS
jgi:hypothetical protein